MIRPGEKDEQALKSPAQVDEAVTRLCCLAKHSIHVRAPRLDFPFFMSTTLLGSLTPLITGDQRNHVHILIDDESHFLKTNARVIELVRKFSSYVAVRKLPFEYSETEEIFIIADQDAFFYMKSADAYPATLGRNSPGRLRQLDHRFEQLWERGEHIAELFTLGL